MLLILLLVLSMYQGSMHAYPLSNDIRDVFAQQQVPSLSPDQRSLWDILWGCLATIFACTWVSVHPNIPNPDERGFRITLRRLELMFWAIVVPEMILFWALRQWMGARRLYSTYKGFGWTMTHAHFLQMGGFRLAEGDINIKILDPITFYNLLEEKKLGFPKISEKEIEDRSKGDGLSKGLAVAQTSWFIVQCISRKFQGLPITELEIATMGLAFFNALMYLLWWNKPVDVRCSIGLYQVSSPTPPPNFVNISRNARSRASFRSTVPFDTRTCFDALSFGVVSPVSQNQPVAVGGDDGTPENDVPAWDDQTQAPTLIELIESVMPPGFANASEKDVGKAETTMTGDPISMKGDLFQSGSETVIISQSVRPEDCGQESTRTPNLAHNELASSGGSTNDSMGDDLNRETAKQLGVPAFCNILLRGPAMISGRLRSMRSFSAEEDCGLKVSTFYAYPEKNPYRILYCMCTIETIGMLFGLIHFAGWSLTFPSNVERLLWRISSITITVIPMIFLVNHSVLGIIVAFHLGGRISKWTWGTAHTLVNCLPMLVTPYLIARVYLVVEAFVSLRRLPEGAYSVVRWTDLVPHFR